MVLASSGALGTVLLYALSLGPFFAGASSGGVQQDRAHAVVDAAGSVRPAMSLPHLNEIKGLAPLSMLHVIRRHDAHLDASGNVEDGYASSAAASASEGSCDDLWIRGFVKVDLCRDVDAPLGPSRCRCELAKRAYHSRFCKMSADNQSDADQFGYGLCDDCCEKRHMMAPTLELLSVLICVLLAVGIALCARKVAKLSVDGADFERVKRELAERRAAGGADGVAPAAQTRMERLRVHVGPLEIGADGIAVKPKFNFGITSPDLYALAGVRDVRDGLAGDVYAQMQKVYSIEGATISDVLKSVKAVDPVPALDQFLEAIPDITTFALEEFGADVKGAVNVEGVVYIYTGVGVTAGLFLGWMDTKGYRMVGMEGRSVALVQVGLAVRGGFNETRDTFRLVLYMANVGCDIVIKLAKG